MTKTVQLSRRKHRLMQLTEHTEYNPSVREQRSAQELALIASRTAELNQQPHFFIVVMGTIIGAILALFIGYHIEPIAWQVALLASIPWALAYLLRKVYLYTLVHYQD